MTAPDLDRPDYAGTYDTPVHALAVAPDGTRHLHAEITVRAPGTARTLCGAWAGVIWPIPPTTVGVFLLPGVDTGARPCPDCLSMAAAEHEVMHQSATRPARALAELLTVLAEDDDQ